MPASTCRASEHTYNQWSTHIHIRHIHGYRYFSMGCSTMDAALTATAVLNGVAVLVLDKATRVYTFVSVHHIAIVTHFTPACVVCAWLSAAYHIPPPSAWVHLWNLTLCIACFNGDPWWHPAIESMSKLSFTAVYDQWSRPGCIPVTYMVELVDKG